MTEKELEMLISYGEDSRIDRKSSLRINTPWHKAEFVKDVIAFANGHERTPAVILIGVDNEGTLTGLNDDFPDEATLQQIVLAYIEPPIVFALRHHTFRNRRLAVLEIPSSSERFHMAAKQINDEQHKVLLRAGEIFIRRGTAKVPLKPLDFKRLKEAHIEEMALKPVLHVSFAQNSQSVQSNQIRMMLKEHFLRGCANLLIKPHLSTINAPVLPLKLFVHNQGQVSANLISIEISVPEDCQAVAAERNEHAPSGWGVRVNYDRTRGFVSGKDLVHGDYCSPGVLYVRFPKGLGNYNLSWQARTGSVPGAVEGTLTVNIRA